MLPRKLLLVTFFTLSRATTVPRGVSPEDAKLYTPSNSQTFKCLTHPSIEIPYGRVNDDFCDCPDGSDEPGSSACAGLSHKDIAIPGFYCRNKGHKPAYLPNSRVNDGICDYDICCDGSDEADNVGGASCPSKCKEIGNAARKMAVERDARRSKAAKARKELVRKAKVLKNEIEDNVASTKIKVQANALKVRELEKKLKETEERERNRVVKPPKSGSRVSVVTQVAKEKVEELRKLLAKVKDERDIAEERLERVEAVLRLLKEEYNPNFNDEGVKRAVRSWEEYLADEEQKRDPAEDMDLNAVLDEETNWDELAGPEEEDVSKLYQLTNYLPPAARDWLNAKTKELREYLVANGMLAPQKTDGTETAAVTAARAALTTAQSEETKVKKHLEQLEKDLAADMGPSGVFRSLKGTCISREFGEYKYELCFMEKATQISRKDNSKTSLGTFSRIDIADETSKNEAAGVFASSWEESHEEPLSGMALGYDNGQQCWNGPKRSVGVELYCSAENEIRNVVEAEKCVYRMEVGTPAVCGREKKEGVARDEL